jgi:hypothetical protein
MRATTVRAAARAFSLAHTPPLRGHQARGARTRAQHTAPTRALSLSVLTGARCLVCARAVTDSSKDGRPAEPQATYKESWRASAPDEDPGVVCFMMPSWMGEANGWVCTHKTALYSEVDSEDSY